MSRRLSGLAISLLLALSPISCVQNSAPQESGSEVESIDFSDAGKLLQRMISVFSRNADDIGRLHKNISNAERLDVIKRVPVSEILSAPGHLELRNPQAVVDMAKILEKAGDGGRAFVHGKEKIVLNVFTKVVTSEDGKTQKVLIRGIEVMDGNHRLAAGLLAKLGEAQDNLAAGLHAKTNGRSVWQTVGDIPEEALEIRVNGSRPMGGGSPNRWIPARIFDDASCTGPCAELRDGRRGYFKFIQDDRGGRAAEVPGGLSSLDETIPTNFRGRVMADVLKRSLDRAGN